MPKRKGGQKAGESAPGEADEPGAEENKTETPLQGAEEPEWDES